MLRRSLLAFGVAACTLPLAGEAPGGPAPSALLGAAGDPTFLTWLDGFYARQLADGWSTTALATLLTGLSSDPSVLAHNAGQPEFSIPVGDYVSRQVTANNAALGRGKRDGVPALGHIDATYGVSADILTAIWGMESGYGAFQGDKDVVRCLATLAAGDPRRSAWAEGELVACLKIVTSGRAARGQLRGSWAGAMGQTQFIPSGFLDTAVSASGGPRPDIWNSSADALASAANLLAKAGWQRGESWGGEVTLSRGFDVGLSEGPKLAPGAWAAKGVARADGRPWSPADAAAAGQLLLPSGAGGPAFLAFPNHFVIRAYNNSLAYALTVGLLADRIGGGGALVAAWPHETPISLEDRMAVQAALSRLGYNPGVPDGMIGLGTRQALRAWQRDHGLPADGHLTPEIAARLKSSRTS